MCHLKSQLLRGNLGIIPHVVFMAVMLMVKTMKFCPLGIKVFFMQTFLTFLTTNVATVNHLYVALFFIEPAICNGPLSYPL